ncbi:alpha/beta hydrolase [Phenylobacterium sp. J426]|uniref:alpha/beta hydrolase n=1 Tax=Phenylobacterium sp. J426 TaxID=2898439 RepID=UPI00215095B9|nr:alpha/beta hydrolase [Phenylobacterium sp. J426]MCR5875575.1 alpha/beta hydrolase [Phenylobacterium sp. J426]
MAWKDPDIEGVRALLAAGAPQPGQPEPTMAQRRAAIDGFGEMVPLADGVSLAPETLAGISTERHTPQGAVDGRRLLYLHGGAYVIGSPRSHRPLASQLAVAARSVAVVPDYRLGPENRFPAAVEDAVAVYAELLKETDAGRIVVAGDSAGGGLSLALALALKQRGLAQPAGYYVISPWADLTQSSETYRTKAATDPMIQRDNVARSAADYLGSADARDPLASPVFGDFRDVAPVLIQVGSEETLLGDSLKVADVAGQACVQVRLEIWPEMIHVFQAFFFQCAAARRAIADAGAWMEARFTS